MSEIEESLKRISAHEGVLGVAILDDAGTVRSPIMPRSAHAFDLVASIALQVHAASGRGREIWGFAFHAAGAGAHLR